MTRNEGYQILSVDTINNPNISISMQELRNSIIIPDKAQSNSKNFRLDEPNSVNMYGLLQKIEDFNSQNLTKEQYAADRLKALNQLKTTISLNMLGDFNIKKGVILYIKNDDLFLDGDYLIKSSTHTIKDNINHQIRVNLESWKN